MVAAVLAVAILLATTVTPGDALTLTPATPPPTVLPASVSVDLPVDPGPMPPVHLGALAASVAALAQWTRRKADYLASLPTTVPDGVRILFVPGHGSPEEGTFDELMGRLGIKDYGDVIEFDYRYIEEHDSHVTASQRASVDDIADGLAAMLYGLAFADGRPIYLIGHSKGAVAIAELLARWDERPALAVDEVVGATLLDPPIAGGWLGLGQSAGTYVYTGLPNDGGYSPHRCDGLFDCRDTRAHLGQRAGVEVVVFRNPDAHVTSFRDDPKGLRVNDVRDPTAGDGLGIDDIGAAHRYPLYSPAVAACIADELRSPGSCNWPIRRWLTGEW